MSFVLQVVGADEDITTHTIFLQSKDEKQIWLTKFNRQIEISNQKKCKLFLLYIKFIILFINLIYRILLFIICY